MNLPSCKDPPSTRFHLNFNDDKMAARSAIAQNLHRLSKLRTVRIWNTQIRDSANDGNPHKAMDLYRQMKRQSVQPNNFTFPFVAKACAQLSDLGLSQMVHAHVLKSPFWSDVYVGAAVVGGYLSCRSMEFARNVFEEMPERDVASWNVLLLGFIQYGLVAEFFEFLRRMRIDDVSLDSITLIGLTLGVTRLGDLDFVRAAHGLAIRLGMAGDVSIANTVISGYTKCGDFVSAELVFAGTGFCFRTVVSWNCLLAGHALSENDKEIMQLYKRMLSDGFRPDVSSFVSILSAFVQPECLACGMLIHAHVIQLAYFVDVCVVNTLIAMYSKCGCVDSAKRLFDGMLWRTCVSWTVMIDGYAQKGNIDEAWQFFLGMKAAGEKPDDLTLVSMISGCAQAGSLELGRWLDQYAHTNGFGDSVRVRNALIDMYAKCGCMNDALRLFHSMPQKTEVSWTTLITGCALNGEFSEALSLFSRMVESGMRPNHITFISVLQACTHAGFLEKGWECFNLMTEEYGISPGLEHYSCMVDLLGRRGRVSEALELIKGMPVRPDAGIWGTLLSACKNHRNIEIGEYAANRLYELEPEASASYVEMANMYACEGRWDGVSEVRKLMRGKAVRKFPGQSHIEVNGNNHRFTAEERLHPHCIRIYEALGVLILHLQEDKMVPFPPNLGADIGASI